MKRFLLTFLCVCSFLTLPVFAQDQPKPDQNELIQASILKPWTGDFDGMIERRVIRALVAPSRTSYWLNGPRQTGAEYELLKAFQEEINNHYKAKGKHILIHVVFIPTSRDQLIPGLLEGRGDIDPYLQQRPDVRLDPFACLLAPRARAQAALSADLYEEIAGAQARL